MSAAKVMEISAESPEGFQTAIRNGMEQASKTVENIKGASVSVQKLKIENGKIAAYLVDIRVTFVLQ
ncbi:MAG: dodecin domain-containing protein [Gammaproteobacteria bacterium]|nr:dodecin domain-containing protein [Gammaproteobacteria bacterium]